jgi:hypothetical protein
MLSQFLLFLLLHGICGVTCLNIINLHSSTTAATGRRAHISILCKSSFNAVAGILASAASTGALQPPSDRIYIRSTYLIEEELFNLVYNKKPSNYNQREADAVEKLTEELISSAKGSKWERNLLSGSWRVAYIRPGQTGGGLDRRIPFPELPFNESYQRFTSGSVTNVGELLGPLLRVEVGGSLKEDDYSFNSTPKRFIANINRGDICAGKVCAKLPIEGEGIFDGMYLGERMRIGQNLNGSGALVLQVRVQ